MPRTYAPNHTPPRGVYAAAITPVRERSNYVDLGAAMEIVDFLNESEALGITLLGTTGNFLNFDIEQREKFAAMALKRVRKPTAVNVSHSTLDVAIHLAEHAADSGAAFALAMPPYYFHYTPQQLEEYFLRLGEHAAPRIPLYLYNIPFFTSPIPVEMAHKLLTGGMYSGIKDSSGKPDYLRGLLDSGANLVVGNDSALAISRKEGAAGVVSGCAGCVPELIVALDRAIVEGDAVREEVFTRHLNELLHWLARFPVPFGVEEACRLRKLPARLDTRWMGAAPLNDFAVWFQSWLPAMLHDAKRA